MNQLSILLGLISFNILIMGIGIIILWILFEIIKWLLVIGLFIKELYED